MRRLKFILCFFAAMGSVAAAQQKTYTIDDFRSLALQRNIGVKSAELQVESAKETQKQAFTRYFPTVSATGMGVLTSEGVLGMSAFNGMLATSFVDKGITVGVTAIQPLFAGGQIVNGNKLAKVGMEVNSTRLTQTQEQVVLSVEQYYWQYVALKEKIKTLDMVERQVDTICRDVQTAVNAGVVLRNDLLQAELKKNSIASDRLKVEDGLRITKMLLAQSIEMPTDSFEIATADLSELLPPDDIRTDHSSALANTVEYQLLDKNVEAGKLQKRMELGKYLPTVGVGVGYMYYHVPDNHIVNIIDESRGYGLAFLSVNIPISGWWGGSHALRQKKAQVKIAEYEKQSNSELLVIKMEQLWNELNQAYKQVQIAKESVEKATENARLNSNYYRSGTVAMSDLLNAQTLLQQSLDQYTTDATTYMLKRTQYLQATGRYQ